MEDCTTDRTIIEYMTDSWLPFADIGGYGGYTGGYRGFVGIMEKNMEIWGFSFGFRVQGLGFGGGLAFPG